MKPLNFLCLKLVVKVRCQPPTASLSKIFFQYKSQIVWFDGKIRQKKNNSLPRNCSVSNYVSGCLDLGLKLKIRKEKLRKMRTKEGFCYELFLLPFVFGSLGLENE